MEYPIKILVAWGEAISGNKEIRDWLIQNGYKELGLFTYALRNKDDARDWLMKNGYPHLMALINGIEGNQAALKWLEKNNLNILRHMALAGDSDEAAFNWLLKNGHREFAMLAKKMEIVKVDIDNDNSDVHKFKVD